MKKKIIKRYSSADLVDRNALPKDAKIEKDDEGWYAYIYTYERTCPSCGREISNEYKLCPYCSKDFGIENERGNEIKENNKESNLSSKPDFILSESDIELGFQIAIKDATKKILFGLLWFMGGLIATLINPFLLFWGAILFGFVDMLIGIYRYLVFRFRFRKYVKSQETGQITDLSDYRIENVMYENLSLINRDIIIKQKKTIQVVLVVASMISIILIASMFSGIINLLPSQAPLYDEDFKLTGDGTTPTDDTLIEYLTYEIETEGYQTINIDLSVDGGKKVDICIDEQMTYSLYGSPDRHVEGVSSYSGSYETGSNARQTISIEIWNSNNYEEVTGHIKIS